VGEIEDLCTTLGDDTMVSWGTDLDTQSFQVFQAVHIFAKLGGRELVGHRYVQIHL
jgi:hypothetical protein